MIDNKLIKGFDGSAGEFGLMFSTKNYKINSEIFSTISMAKEVSNKKNKTFSGEDIFKLAKEGDEIAISSLNKFFEMLAALSLNLEFILNPEHIIYSGGITNQEKFYERLIQARKELMDKNKILNVIKLNTKHKLSKHKSLAQLAGSAYIWYKGE